MAMMWLDFKTAPFAQLDTVNVHIAASLQQLIWAKGINDSHDHARALAQIIRDRPVETRCPGKVKELDGRLLLR